MKKNPPATEQITVTVLPSGEFYIGRNPTSYTLTQLRIVLKNARLKGVDSGRVRLTSGSFDRAHWLLDVFFEAGFRDVAILLISIDEIEAPSTPIQLP